MCIQELSNHHPLVPFLSSIFYAELLNILFLLLELLHIPYESYLSVLNLKGSMVSSSLITAFSIFYMQVIPRQLCDNAGFDSTDVLNKLRQKHASG